MQSEYAYPTIGNRSSPKEWLEEGSPTIIDLAEAKTREILSTHYPDHIPDSLDTSLREEFPIKLDRAKMRPS